ncbi:sensor histidine kinase [Streptomyces sp. NPDC018031]|uniref:sensor histidine kinase n=1 Tax=Streptomyces sp. NPDC018031 TaxID=3365033 RepID=UPI0037A5173F
MSSANVQRALLRPDYLRTSWPWRSAVYLLSGALLGAASLVGIAVLAVVGGILALVLVGLPIIAMIPLLGLPLGRIERWRVGLVDADPVESAHRLPDEPGLAAWLRFRFRERATWAELGYALLLALGLWVVDLAVVLLGLGVPAALLATPVMLALDGGGQTQVLKHWPVTSYPDAGLVAVLGLVAVFMGLYGMGAVAGVRGGLVRTLIGPPVAGTPEEWGEMARSRARLVDAFEAERRRIERDLHDGAQQRLVALSMALGLARLDAPPGPLADQLAKAHHEAERALAELRELIHGIHPQVLTDRGLIAAFEDAADRSPTRVLVSADGLGRLPEPVEKAAYFVTCEALANIAKHSGAELARIDASVSQDTLFLSVTDDGVGGAVLTDGLSAGAGSSGTTGLSSGTGSPRRARFSGETGSSDEPGVSGETGSSGRTGSSGERAGGSGLTGLSDRVAALGGRLTLSSPPGGPTVLKVEIPCGPIAASG